MGLTRVTTKLTNIKSPDKTYESLFLVDTGATDTLVPSNELEDRDAVVTAEIVQPGGRLLTWAVAGAIILAFLVIDLFTPQQMRRSRDSEFVFALMLGICIAQVNLIAVWASLAPGNIILRIFWSLLLTMAMWYGLILGNRLADPLYYGQSSMARPDAILLIIILLAGVAVLQVPLWIAKKVFRWRLTRRQGDDEASLQEDRQFHLKHLLIAMFLVSAALSPLHQVLPSGSSDTFRLEGTMFVLLGAVILCNLVITIPCIWWAFLSARRLTRMLLVWPIYCIMLTAVEFGCLCAMLGPPGQEILEPAIVFCILNLSQCATVLGVLLVFRAIGFRLVRMPAGGNG